MATKRSQVKKTASAIAPAIPPQADHVAVNWVFFDKAQPHDKALPIDIPQQLFQSNLLKCRDLFVTELLERVKFRASLETIGFWQPKGRISSDEANRKGWTDGISTLEDQFNSIPFTSNLAYRLKNIIDDKEVLHLIVTAKGRYLSSEMDDGGLVGELPEFRDQHDSKRLRLSGPEISKDHSRFWKRLWIDKVNPIKEVDVNRGSDPVEEIFVPATIKVLHGLPEIFAFNDVLVREEYENAFEIIKEHLKVFRNIVIVGHPGIGKTILLYYILAIRLFKQQPTLFQYRPDVILLFDENGVEELLPRSELVYPNTTDVWALVDSNESVPTPAEILTRATSPVPLIIASSPRASRWRVVERYRPPIAYWFIKPFTLEELFQARQLQMFEVKESDVQDFFETYGPSARDCYAYCSVTKFYLSLIRTKIAGMTWDTITKALTMGRDGLTLEEGSHRVILVEPHPKDNTFPRIRIVTKAVSQLLWEQDTNERGGNYRKLFKTLRLDPSARSLVGVLLEPPFHQLCARGARFKVYPMAHQSTSGSLNRIYFNYSLNNPEDLVLNPQTQVVFNRTQPITKLLADHYYRPTSGTQPSYDSFIYSPNACQISAFQVINGDSHDLKPEGIYSLFALAQELDVKDLKLRFIIVVPEGCQVKCPVEKKLIDKLGVKIYSLEVTENELYEGFVDTLP